MDIFGSQVRLPPREETMSEMNGTRLSPSMQDTME
jgi:hypothetical protein